LIVCQITSQYHLDNYSILLDDNDFTKGSLNLKSYIRPNKIISIDKNIIIYKVGLIKNEKLFEVIDSVINIVNG
jgi:mRNA interferase MazF